MDDIFTAQDISDAEMFENLGPQYFAARRIVERAMEPFEAEHFKPLIDAFKDQFAEKMWDHVRDHLLSDTELNMQGDIRHMVERTVFALLSGEKWALNMYPLAKYHEGKSVRKAIFDSIGPELTDKRVADLEAENKRLKEQLEWARR